MKKVIWFIFAAVCLSACSESMEEKANKLIKKELSKVIVNIDTYEPIETLIDSAFAPIVTAETYSILEALPAQIKRLAEFGDEADKAKIGMSLNESRFYSFQRENYIKFKDQYESASKKYDELESKLKTINERFSKMTEEKPTFNGYQVLHQYRYTKTDGTKTIGKHVFLMNKNLSEVEAMLDLEDEDIKAMFEAFKLNNFGE